MSKRSGFLHGPERPLRPRCGGPAHRGIAPVKAAALAAVPGATVIRVETDSEGSAYEAHLTKSDGTQVTVKVDAGFKVTETAEGFGGAPGHGSGLLLPPPE